MLNEVIRSLPGVPALRRQLDNQYERDDFVTAELNGLAAGTSILDAGCGSQRYRKYCRHLDYKAQDFGQYKRDEKCMLGADGVAVGDYPYGELDYVGDIWNIQENDETFGAILCTEVLEHVPFPIDTVREFRRLLKPGGKLILTAPSNCLRHFDPYFFYSGFSDRWFERILGENGFTIERLDTVGDYYRWLAVEMARTASVNSLFAKVLLLPSFLYFYSKRRTKTSSDTLCMGYHVVARKN